MDLKCETKDRCACCGARRQGSCRDLLCQDQACPKLHWHNDYPYSRHLCGKCWAMGGKSSRMLTGIVHLVNVNGKEYFVPSKYLRQDRDFKYYEYHYHHRYSDDAPPEIIISMERFSSFLESGMFMECI
jgi:hypothetical protein